MIKIQTSSSFLLLLAAGCAALPGHTVSFGTEGPPADIAAGTRGATVMTVSDEVTAPATPAEVSVLQDAEGSQDPHNWLDVWEDISFRRRFAESYFPDTQIEPATQPTELEAMQPIMEAISTGKLDWAENLLQAEMSPSASAIFDFTLGNVKFQREQMVEAAAAYRQAIDKFPKFRRAWKNLAISYVKQADYASATRGFAKVLELGGTDAVTYGLLAYSYAMTGDHIAAESAYRMAAMFDPDLIDWKMGLARSLFKQERFADVAALLDTMVAENEHRADLWLLQANAFLGMNQPQKAAENFEIVDHLGQSTADSLNTLGDIYVNQEMFELAVAAYERAISRDPAAAIGKAMRAAKVLISRNAMAEGKRLIAVAEEVYADTMSPEDKKDALKLRARIALASNASEEQVAILEEIVDLDPLDGEALILLGQHYGKHNELDRAALYYEQAANIPAFEADAKVRHAQLLVREGKYVDALPLLRQAQSLDPRDNVQEWLEKVERYAQGR